MNFGVRVPGLLYGIICVILRLAVLIQYRSVTDTHTTTTAYMIYTALSIASRGKNRNISAMNGPILTKFCMVMRLSSRPSQQIKLYAFNNSTWWLIAIWKSTRSSAIAEGRATRLAVEILQLQNISFEN